LTEAPGWQGADGRRFLMTRRERAFNVSGELIVVQGWFAEVERLTSQNR